MCFFRLLNLFFEPKSALRALLISSLIPPLLRPELAAAPIFGVALFVRRKSRKVGHRWRQITRLDVLVPMRKTKEDCRLSNQSLPELLLLLLLLLRRLSPLSVKSIRSLSLSLRPRSISTNSSLVAEACFTKPNGVCLEDIDLCLHNNLSSRSNVNAGFPNPGLLDVAYAARLAFAALSNVSKVFSFSSLLRNLNSSSSSSFFFSRRILPG